MKNIIILILFAILQQSAPAQSRHIAPIFLHGDGSGEWSYGVSESRPLSRLVALGIISDELIKAKYTVQSGPLLLDGFTTKEVNYNYVISSEDPNPLELDHPFFFDFFIPKLGIAVKYI
jgi:hypothetical protein